MQNFKALIEKDRQDRINSKKAEEERLKKKRQEKIKLDQEFDSIFADF